MADLFTVPTGYYNPNPNWLQTEVDAAAQRRRVEDTLNPPEALPSYGQPGNPAWDAFVASRDQTQATQRQDQLLAGQRAYQTQVAGTERANDLADTSAAQQRQDQLLQRYVDPIVGGLGGGTGTGGGSLPALASAAGVPGGALGGGPSGSAGGPGMPDASAANAAVFARAKDKVGKIGASSLRSLQESLAGRGMLGGGVERQSMGELAEAGQGALGDVVRTQAINEAGTNTDNARLGFTGGVTMRGQDVTGQGNQLAAATQQRGQDLDYALGRSGQTNTLLAGLLRNLY